MVLTIADFAVPLVSVFVVLNFMPSAENKEKHWLVHASISRLIQYEDSWAYIKLNQSNHIALKIIVFLFLK